jgi:predicted Zn finger-like uncharacterized protein
MILTCPQCSTRYHVDPASLGTSGRTVRCASCGHRWLGKPPSDTPKVIELNPAPAVAAPRMWPVTAPDKPRVTGSGSLVGWLVGVLILLVAASAVIGRNEIVAGFPASASIYQKLGLPVAFELGLKFEGVTSRRLQEGGVAVLVVEGEVVNVSDRNRPVPPIAVSLLDSGERRLQQELFRAADVELEPGAKTSFSGRLVNPAEQARTFSVTFEVNSSTQ